MVVWTATDEAKNTVTCEQMVTVLDTTGPTLVCPIDTVRDAGVECAYLPPDGGGASFLGTPTVSDNCSAPGGIALTSDAPDSFNPGTTMRYHVPKAGRVKLTIYDSRGTTVTQIVDARQGAGRYEVEWDGTDRQGNLVAAGVYVARLVTSTGAQTLKLVLAK